MDGLVREHRDAQLREGRLRHARLFNPRILERIQGHIGAALPRSKASQNASDAAAGRSLAPFLALPLHRPDVAARRLAFVGQLTPETGVADLLWAADAWAERHGKQMIRIVWAGEGDLKDVLVGQPTAANLLQDFVSPQSALPLAAVFGRCGMLVAPILSEGVASVIATAMAAGLPVLASSRQTAAVRWIVHGRTGWLFDPRLPGTRLEALERAMATPAAVLAQMRERARARAVATENTVSIVRWPWRRATARLESDPLFQGLG